MSGVGKILLLLTTALLAVSCGGMVQRRVAVESVESVERLGWSGADITLRVRNGLRRDVMLDSCRIDCRVPSGVLATAELRGGVSIDRLTAGDVRLRMKISSANPSAMQLLWRRMADGNTGDMLLDVEAAVRIGGSKRRICAPALSLSEILRNFGVSEDDFATWFQ